MSEILVVGAGPAGLSAGLELARAGRRSVIVDKNDQLGGLARTIAFQDCLFDLGPHRFFTKNEEIVRWWKELLADDLLEVDRLTRIYYRGKLIPYPLQAWPTFKKLGVPVTVKSLTSYAVERGKRHREEPANFEEWVVRQFGRTLYEIFFKSYTEKVWGIPCQEIGREWADQRIKGLSLSESVRKALGAKSSAKSLVDKFYYPRYGAGQLYEVMGKEILNHGSEIALGAEALSFETNGRAVTAVECEGRGMVEVDQLFASCPITSIPQRMTPRPPEHILRAAKSLYYRSHITVNLVLDRPTPFPDNWIYIHDPSLQMARVASYGNFSDAMVRDAQTSAISAEYFCFENDELWSMSDEGLIALAARELRDGGLIDAEPSAGFVVREGDSYPAYYLGHRDQFEVLADYLARFENLHLIGRAGMYRYNNQDHAMLTGIYSVRNFLGMTDVDLTTINPDGEYLEEIQETSSGSSKRSPVP